MAACTVSHFAHRCLSSNDAVEFDTRDFYLAEASDDDLSPLSDSIWTSIDLICANNGYADAFEEDCLAYIEDNSANDGEDYFAASLEGRATVSLPCHVFRSLIDDEEDDEEVPPIKRCETATRHMLRQMSARREGSSQRPASTSSTSSTTSRKNMMKMTISTFRSMLVPANKTRC